MTFFILCFFFLSFFFLSAFPSRKAIKMENSIGKESLIFIFIFTFFISLLTQFDLVCEKDIYPTLGLVALNIGGPIGVYLFGVLNDRYGRRFSYFSCLATLLTGSFVTAFSTSFGMWAFSRIIVGLTIPAVYQIPFIIGKELSSNLSPKKRKKKKIGIECESKTKQRKKKFVLFNFSVGTCWTKLSFFCDCNDLYILHVWTNGIGCGNYSRT